MKRQSYNAGAANGRHVLTDTDAAVIRHAVRLGGKRGTAAALARQYGVARSTITRIVRGETWKHTGGTIHDSNISG